MLCSVTTSKKWKANNKSHAIHRIGAIIAMMFSDSYSLAANHAIFYTTCLLYGLCDCIHVSLRQLSFLSLEHFVSTGGLYSQCQGEEGWHKGPGPSPPRRCRVCSKGGCYTLLCRQAIAWLRVRRISFD